MKVLSV